MKRSEKKVELCLPLQRWEERFAASPNLVFSPQDKSKQNPESCSSVRTQKQSRWKQRLVLVPLEKPHCYEEKSRSAPSLPAGSSGHSAPLRLLCAALWAPQPGGQQAPPGAQSCTGCVQSEPRARCLIEDHGAQLLQSQLSVGGRFIELNTKNAKKHFRRCWFRLEQRRKQKGGCWGVPKTISGTPLDPPWSDNYVLRSPKFFYVHLNLNFSFFLHILWGAKCKKNVKKCKSFQHFIVIYIFLIFTKCDI